MLSYRFLIKALLIVLSACSMAASSSENPVQLLVKTDAGNFTMQLYPDKAPATVENFLAYVRNYYYDGLIFHRVVKNFVIQSGGYTFDLSAKEPRDPVVNESSNGLKNTRGSVAMARHADPDSARAQFYINLKDNPTLDANKDKPGYTVFGSIVSGIEVVDAIASTAVYRKDAFTHLPVEPLRILSIREIPTQ